MRICLNLPVALRVRSNLAALFAAVLLAACGGGSDDISGNEALPGTGQPATVSFSLFSDEEGWHMGIAGLAREEVQSITVNGVDITGTIRLLETENLGSSISDDEGHFFASSRNLADDGLPKHGAVSIATKSGSSYFLSFGVLDVSQGNVSSTILSTSEGMAVAQKVNWAKIWSTAKKMALSGVLSSVVKAYLKKNGYICPAIGPWWLCGRPVS